ncbi:MULTISPECIES: hypothetical protein [unclassified Leptolyngbya]|uniref:hypothetical protein n=1 Tax=unclassified Leptolyngbya TaxID=2650499 RepID=UPI0016858CD7|nr:MULTISPECIES: hypothetical protein [unclassified Leptolyngbya]MBD1909650.1 hypothetical protein [Leptolyngbya sp. FACHB-8]MBD2157573.1 hypothetical protein [Leptolyngbya sp. FACHB-16]
MATFSISDSINLVAPDGFQEDIQALIDAIESSIDIPLSDVDLSPLIDSALTALGDGELSQEELTSLSTTASELGESLGITDAEGLTILSAFEDVIATNNTLITDDNLTGTAANDIVYGGQGNDTLTGTAATTTGVGEVDVLIGGSGSDTFGLGNTASAFYNDGDASTDGALDFAAIADFTTGNDVIQLQGQASDYVLAELPASLGVTGTSISYSPEGATTPELIGVVYGVSLTSFDTSFVFV